jgi:transposase-like protein
MAKYTEDFKRAAVARIVAGESPAVVSRDIGVDSNSLIYAWRDKYAGDIKRSAKAAAKMAPDVLLADGVPSPHFGPKGRTVYPLALKQRAVTLVKIEKLSVQEAAKQLSVAPDRIHKWVKEGIKRGAKGEIKRGLPAVQAPPSQVIVATPTRQHRGAPSPFSSKDTRQYLLMMEASTLAGIREGRIKTLREHPELVLALNALVACERGEE